MTPIKSLECHVCGKCLDRLHINYGGISCEGCRVFFRRHCLTKRHQNGCKEKNCQVPNEFGTTCAFCRFDKCLR